MMRRVRWAGGAALAASLTMALTVAAPGAVASGASIRAVVGAAMPTIRADKENVATALAAFDERPPLFINGRPVNVNAEGVEAAIATLDAALGSLRAQVKSQPASRAMVRKARKRARQGDRPGDRRLSLPGQGSRRPGLGPYHRGARRDAQGDHGLDQIGHQYQQRARAAGRREVIARRA